MITDILLGQAAVRYGFDQSECRPISGVREEQKRLFTFPAHGKAYVLRLVESTAGEAGQTEAEMDWLLYLAQNGAAVPCPLKTRDGKLAFSMEGNGVTYVASAFSRIEGVPWDKNDPNRWNKEVFHHWGKAVGELHRISQSYVPSREGEKRPEFSIRSMVSETGKAFPTVSKIAQDLFQEIEALPKDKASYGLIHNDLHPGNFLINGGRIYLVDFDGCAYSWYAFDIGNALYLALWMGRSNDAGTDFTTEIVSHFLKGYLSVNPMDDFWLSKIPLFMMACKLALFGVGCDSENPGGGNQLEGRKEQVRNIENRILFPDCQFDSAFFQNR